MVIQEVDQNLSENALKEPKSDGLKPFTLEILKLIKDSQQQHGLRHGDYQRYRGYCSRRVRRLRKVLKLPQGDRRHFKKRDVTEAHIVNPKSDERFLHIPLVLAERNWAYAMQLRQESNTELRKKFHLVRKLRKACTYALQLQELCSSVRCDARTKLEAEAYVAWMHGTLHFELQLWPSAAENLKKAQVVYEKLSSALPEDEQGPYRQRFEELTPSLRYCAYNIGDDKAIDLLELRSQGVLENFDVFVTQSKEKTAAVLHEAEWFGIKVPVRIERVQLFLKSIEGLDESLKRAEDVQAKIKILENMFIDLRDLISLTRDEARGDNKEAQLLLSYLLSIRIERTVQRNLYLIQQTRKAQDIVRLLDIIIQQVTELSQLDPIKDKEDAQTALEQRLVVFRAMRCFYVAKSHAAVRRWKEAAILYDRCIKYVNDTSNFKLPDDLKEITQSLQEDAPCELSTAKAHFVLEKEEDEPTPIVPVKTYKSKKPLVERLDEFREDPQLLTKNPNIVSLPPAMEPVPAKPLFYDLALNFVQFPSLQDKIDGGQQKQKQGTGISGFVKGLWGWGSSSNK